MKKKLLIAVSALLLLTACSGEPEQTAGAGNTDTGDTPSAAQSGSVTPEVSQSVTHGDASLLTNKNDEVIEIPEKLFIAQTNDIYINAEDYLGKTIKYQGFFMQDTWEGNGQTYRYVMRYGPGCCGDDDMAGFEVTWDGEYPEEDDWVEATGTLEFYEEDGYKYLRINLTSLEVMEERGAEYVYT